ncbi:MAG: pyruvate dehydrogenase, partial [Spirochaeta sp. LUC14_002_19_P3]
VSRRAEAYGIPGKRIDGNDVFEVYKAVKAARAHVGKKGPYLIAAETYRYMGHSKSDANRYRSREEIDAWKKKDPIDNMRKLLEKHDIFTAAELNDFETAARQRIEDAVEYAVNSPEPDTADLPLDVYSD